jgi:phage terminase large subunit GpA-like protein
MEKTLRRFSSWEVSELIFKVNQSTFRGRLMADPGLPDGEVEEDGRQRWFSLEEVNEIRRKMRVNRRSLLPERPKGKRALRFYSVGTQDAKSVIAKRLALKGDGGPGFSHFPPWLVEKFPRYFKELTSNVKRRSRDQSGHWVARWVLPESRRDEALDCRVYSYAALKALLHNRKVRLDKPHVMPPDDGPETFGCSNDPGVDKTGRGVMYAPAPDWTQGY